MESEVSRQNDCTMVLVHTRVLREGNYNKNRTPN
jgi:hypothetical protein